MQNWPIFLAFFLSKDIRKKQLKIQRKNVQKGILESPFYYLLDLVSPFFQTFECHLTKMGRLIRSHKGGWRRHNHGNGQYQDGKSLFQYSCPHNSSLTSSCFHSWFHWKGFNFWNCCKATLTLYCTSASAKCIYSNVTIKNTIKSTYLLFSSFCILILIQKNLQYC